MDALAWVSLGVLAYIYVGYPLLLRSVVALRGPKRIARADITPPVSLVISAYNEAAVIRQKLSNALELDYPPGRLQIVVVSDASDDGTDEIVREFERKGVVLMRQMERRGKTAGLNAVVPELTGDIVVFSDANAMYRTDAVRKLVRNFADPAVGCVTGESRYTAAAVATGAELGERAYWDYETQQKRLETALGSTVGGDGAIYAIRKQLWQPLPEAAINDFLNPLQIVGAGWRAVYEPEAVCVEEAAGRTASEYRRRVRIVSRSWRAIFQAPSALNPFRVGFFAISLLSHKVLRWWSGAFVLTVIVVLVAKLPGLLAPVSNEARAATAVAAVLALAVPQVRRLASVSLYFLAIHAASLHGLAKGSVGRISGTWRPPRQRDVAMPRAASIALLIGGAALVAVVVAIGPKGVALAAFWASVSALVYVYVAYPLLAGGLAAIRPRPVVKHTAHPRVALLIPANDEADVIGAKLENALAADYPRHLLRIIVASDGSTDGTNGIVASYADNRVELVSFAKRQGKMACVNATVTMLHDVEVVVFSDANVFLDRSAIRVLVSNLHDPHVGAVSADVVLVGERAALGWPEDLYYRYERWLQTSESALGSMIGVDGALYAIRRELFLVQPPDTILDDLAIPMAILRQGRRVVFEPDAVAVEQGSQSSWEEFSRKARVIAGAAQFLTRALGELRRYPRQVVFSLMSHKVLRWLSPGLLVVAVGCSAALSSEGMVYGAFAATHGVLLVLGGIGCIPTLRRIRPIGLAHYFCLVQIAAIVGFVRGLRGRQPSAWERFARQPVASRAGTESASPARMS